MLTIPRRPPAGGHGHARARGRGLPDGRRGGDDLARSAELEAVVSAMAGEAAVTSRDLASEGAT
jgi:hypothetical protein